MAVDDGSRVHKRAAISCACGDVHLRFPTAAPLHCWECCCVDCHARAILSAKMTGEALPMGISEDHARCKPLVIYYFTSRILVVKGKDKPKFTKLDEAGKVTHMVAGCCGAMLLGDHPVYEGKVTGFYPEFREPMDVEHTKPSARIFIKDIPPERLAEMSPLPGLYLENGKPQGDPEGLNAWQSFIGHCTSPVPEEDTTFGESFAELLAASTGEVTIMKAATDEE